jgi:tetratricopeptide (TPR) repeat protein
MAQKASKAYPASAARLQVALVLESLQNEKAAELRTEVQALTDTLNRMQGEWGETQAAAALGAVIERLAAGGGPASLRLALAAYADFRRHSREPVPEAMALFEAAAQRGLVDPATARGYIEYLWSSRDTAGQPLAGVANNQSVLDALQTACQPDRPEADRLNRLVVQWLQMPWAHLNLLVWHSDRGQLAEAAREWQAAQALGLAVREPALLLRIGRLHRELGAWEEAERVFADCLALEAIEPIHREPAEVLQLEAHCRRIGVRLARGEACDGEPWGALHTEAQSLYARHRQAMGKKGIAPPDRQRAADLAQQVLPILLDLDTRLHEPRAAIARAFAHPIEFSLNGHAGCLLHLGLLNVEAGQPAGSACRAAVQRGSWLLARGHLQDCADLLQRLEEQATTASDVQLLAARLALHSGEIEAARDRAAELADDLPAEERLAIEIELALGDANILDAEELLSRPATALLSLVDRETFRAILLGLLGDWREAFAHLQRLLAKVPDSPHVLNVAGWECLFAGQDDIAAECFARTLAIDPDHYGALLGRWLVSPQPDAADAERLQSEEPLLSGLVCPRRRRLLSAGRHDLVERLDRDLLAVLAVEAAST